MFRFVFLVLALVSAVAISLGQTNSEKSKTDNTANAAIQQPMWNQEHTALPATTFPAFAAASSWSGKLNPSGTVFDSGFRAFYFDRTSSRLNAIERQVSNVQMKYSWDDFHDIDSEKFAAYWVGQVHFDKPTKETIFVNQGHSKTRIFIDGILVHESSDDTSFQHQFSKGAHLVEVDYINEWHTVDFRMKIGRDYISQSQEEIGRAIRAIRGKPNIYYLGAYESGRSDFSTNVTLPKTGRPAILWLDSYHAVEWVIDAPDGIEAAIIASHSPGASVSGADPKVVYHTDESIGVWVIEPSDCACVQGRMYHCENEDGAMDQAQETIGKLTGLSLTGFAVEYDPDLLDVRPWNENVLARVMQTKQRISDQRAICLDS